MSEARARERYEKSDANAGPVFLYAFVLALVLGAAMAASAWLSQSTTSELRAEAQVNPLSELREGPAGPALQAIPARELEQHRAWEEGMLHDTEWVDALNGVVRIPIERAIELSLQEGFPLRALEPDEEPK